eukprot:c18143_g1_i1.p1 GENE.c18143_g1_i1~~c18143_g1_i1.p1  ORF type:complete len:573 (-),score=261.86 c18143_g1_i1:119-1837(-)
MTAAKVTTVLSLFVGLLCVIIPINCSSEIGNPYTTTGSLKGVTLNQISVEEPNLSGADLMTNQAVVEAKFQSTPVNIETLKTFAKQRGLTDSGLIQDLIDRNACIIRLEADMGQSIDISPLQSYLSLRELSTAGNRDELFDRSCDYLNKERLVRVQMKKPVGDITKDELKAELSKLGFITTSGSKADLVFRLGKAVSDIETIKKLSGDSEFNTSELPTALSSRGLGTDGATDVLLARLAGYLVEVTSSAGISGISSQCDMIVGGSTCISGGQYAVPPPASTRGLVGRWSFDDSQALDSSGLGNHAKSSPAVGPGRFGNGASARFDGSQMMEIPHSTDFESPDFCVTLWLYLLGDSTGQWRSLLHKGSKDQERTPTLFLEPYTRGVEFFVSTSSASQPAGERLWSNTFIPLKQWTHIAACAEGRNLRLFINGLLDAENTTIGTPILNKGSMFVGSDPWRTSGGVNSYVDELRYYSRALTADEIQAQVHSSIGGSEASFVELGCMGCSIDSCSPSCRRGYHMCTNRDISSGAYIIARGMGWANSETKIWSAEDARDSANTPNSSGLCMCCRDDE